MIKLKSIMRDAGIISEQEQAAKTITVTSQTTRDQLAQQTANIPVGTEVTINFNVESIIPDNEILSSQQANKVAEQIKMITQFIDSGKILVIAHASLKPATMKKADQNGKVEQPAVLKQLFPNFKHEDYTNLTFTPLNAKMFGVEGNSTPQTRDKGNTNLAINRAASIGSTITAAGIDLSKFKVEYDIKTNQTTAWVGIQMTGTYIKKPETEANLHRVALGFGLNHVELFAIRDLNSGRPLFYDNQQAKVIRNLININVDILNSAESDQIKYLDAYKWLSQNINDSHMASYNTGRPKFHMTPEFESTAMGKKIANENVQLLVKTYGATRKKVNPETQIRLEDNTVPCDWFIYDERKIVQFFKDYTPTKFKQLLKDQLKQMNDAFRQQRTDQLKFN
jgi:hypothetical protein